MSCGELWQIVIGIIDIVISVVVAVFIYRLEQRSVKREKAEEDRKAEAAENEKERKEEIERIEKDRIAREEEIARKREEDALLREKKRDTITAYYDLCSFAIYPFREWMEDNDIEKKFLSWKSLYKNAKDSEEYKKLALYITRMDTFFSILLEESIYDEEIFKNISISEWTRVQTYLERFFKVVDCGADDKKYYKHHILKTQSGENRTSQYYFLNVRRYMYKYKMEKLNVACEKLLVDWDFTINGSFDNKIVEETSDLFERIMETPETYYNGVNRIIDGKINGNSELICNNITNVFFESEDWDKPSDIDYLKKCAEYIVAYFNYFNKMMNIVTPKPSMEEQKTVVSCINKVLYNESVKKFIANIYGDDKWIDTLGQNLCQYFTDLDADEIKNNVGYNMEFKIDPISGQKTHKKSMGVRRLAAKYYVSPTP